MSSQEQNKVELSHINQSKNTPSTKNIEETSINQQQYCDYSQDEEQFFISLNQEQENFKKQISRRESTTNKERLSLKLRHIEELQDFIHQKGVSQIQTLTKERESSDSLQNVSKHSQRSYIFTDQRDEEMTSYVQPNKDRNLQQQEQEFSSFYSGSQFNNNYDFNYKDQVKLLSVQVQDYRERLFREETLKQKVFIELEKQELRIMRLLSTYQKTLENEYGKLEKERDTFKKMLIEKDREIQCIKKDYNQLQGRVSMGQVATGVFDTMMNDSVLSDLRNELYTAKKLQGYEKEELLFEIQDKLNQLITDTKPQFEYMNKFQEVVLENQQLHIELNSQDQYIKDINSQLNQYQIKNQQLQNICVNLRFQSFLRVQYKLLQIRG